jgi:uncharacterized protein (TIGR03435 family)
MSRTKLWAGLAIVNSLALFGQTAAPPPAFEVASVKRNPAGYGPSTRMNESGASVNFINVPLKWVIRRAYQVQDSRISGPDWLDSEGYDIVAKFPPGTTSRERNAMFQTLLAERFKLAVHRETRELAAYLLVVRKGGAKIQQADAVAGGFQVKMDGPIRHLRTKTTLAGLAVYLSDQLLLPVQDRTELKGVYDIALDWTLDDSIQTDKLQPNLPTLPSAVEAQLGLKLEAKKVAMEVVVVDHVEKVPTEN